MNLQRGDNVCVAAVPDGTFRIESFSLDGNRATLMMNRSELAALCGALDEMLKFYSIND